MFSYEFLNLSLLNFDDREIIRKLKNKVNEIYKSNTIEDWKIFIKKQFTYKSSWEGSSLCP